MIKNFKVKNLENNGRQVPNQFLIEYTENGNEYQIFQSYSSMIIKCKDWEIIEVGKDWDYSRTTGKYRNILTRKDKKGFEKMLKEDFEWDEENQIYKMKINKFECYIYY